VRNPDEGPAKNAVDAEHTAESTEPSGPARLIPPPASNATSSKRTKLRSDDQSARRRARPVDFEARIAEIRAAVQSTWISRGFSTMERRVLHDLARRLAELLDEDEDPAI